MKTARQLLIDGLKAMGADGLREKHGFSIVSCRRSGREDGNLF